MSWSYDAEAEISNFKALRASPISSKLHRQRYLESLLLKIANDNKNTWIKFAESRQSFSGLSHLNLQNWVFWHKNIQRKAFQFENKDERHDRK